MSMLENVVVYAQAVREQYLTGHAKEHAYRPALQKLMKVFEDVEAVNDPKKSEYGNPDMVFLKGSNKSIILGYAEAKDIDISLDKTEKSEQMHRYSGYDNLYLTNYIEFRFLKNGEKQETITIGLLKNGVLELLPENYGSLADELQAFLDSKPEHIRSGKRLVLIMGAKARRIRDRINRKFTDESITAGDELTKIFEVMRQLLVHDLTQEKFADMYAQTLVYGLFVARYGDTTKESFSREEARDLIPSSNPFLKDFFDHIAGSRFDKDLAQIVDELCEVFQVSDVNDLIQKHLRLFDVENEKDPIIHFYEDFLKEYDPAERKKMGAYYTPLPVVKFMIRQVDEILKTEFGLPKGLADDSKKQVEVTNSQGKPYKTDMHRVQVLDPAVGTATFLNEIIKFVHKKFDGQEGRWPSYAKDSLVPRLHGFELMMAPYTIAHLKLGMTLRDEGVTDIGDRLGVYLTNTLEEGAARQSDIFTALGLAETISHEAEEASKIKNERPIMVIIGNPPYSGESSNNTDYANSLVSKYKIEPGGKQKLQERNPKWINDDYVKFMAFAEDLVIKNGEGIIAMITNHGYLDNPTFRGMRWHLAKTFDRIYILDLHGNAKKKEITPDGSRDENIFDIMQGVSIIVAVKTTSKKQAILADVFCADIFGSRRHKFDELSVAIDWKKVTLDVKMLYFTDIDNEGLLKYQELISVQELMPLGSVGVVTSSDEILIAESKEALLSRVNRSKLSGSEEKISKRLSLHEVDGRFIQPIQYRPFDTRYVYYALDVIERPREKVMRHFVARNNVGISLHKREELSGDWAHALIVDKVTEHGLTSSKSTNFQFPLYIFHDDGSRTVNFDQRILKKLTKYIKPNFEPEDILDYIYGILYSPKYRDKYNEFLKIDFPRVPVPKNDTEFKHFASYGTQLRGLHLMKSPLLDECSTTYPIAPGDEYNNNVDGVPFFIKTNDWAEGNGKVWINSQQYFGNVPETAWSFYVGGYQPAQKWLKDRKGRELSNEDLDHYQKIIKILTETDRIMKEIDLNLYVDKKK